MDLTMISNLKSELMESAENYNNYHDINSDNIKQGKINKKNNAKLKLIVYIYL